MDVQPVKMQRLYLQVAKQLSATITSGEMSLGDRLPSERDLAVQFGVSRPTIREAMIALEVAGQVEVRSGSGVYIRDVAASPRALLESQEPGPFEILEARKMVEGETCALAAQRVTEEQLAALAELVDEMAEENRKEDITEKADERFHCLIAEASGNSALAAIVAWLWQLRNNSEISVHFQLRIREEGIRPLLQDHQAIVGALSRGDADSARTAMQSHLQRVVDQLMEAM